MKPKLRIRNSRVFCLSSFQHVAEPLWCKILDDAEPMSKARIFLPGGEACFRGDEGDDVSIDAGLASAAAVISTLLTTWFKDPANQGS